MTVIYDNPYRDATLVECGDNYGGFYHAISVNKEDDRVMSSAAYDVVERLCTNWFTQSGVVCCLLDVEEQVVKVFITAPDGDDHFAEFTLPFAELVLSAAHTAQERLHMRPSDVSAMLRELADDIDTTDNEGAQ